MAVMAVRENSESEIGNSKFLLGAVPDATQGVRPAFSGLSWSIGVSANEVVDLHRPLALDVDSPRARTRRLRRSSLWTASVTWMRPGDPWDSMRAAVFTVSPQTS